MQGDSFLEILPRSQVSFRGLDGGVAQQELNLLEVATGCAAELGAGPPHVHGGKLIDESGLAGVLACNPKALTSQQRKQLAQVGEHVISAITDSRELKDGYAFLVEPTKASLMDVAQWLDVWRRCCPFYEFQIDVQAADASVWLSVKGRPGVKEYIPVDSPLLADKLRK